MTGESETTTTTSSCTKTKIDYALIDELSERFDSAIKPFDAKLRPTKRKKDKHDTLRRNLTQFIDVKTTLMSSERLKEIESEQKSSNRIKPVLLEITDADKRILSDFIDQNLLKNIDGILNVGREAVILQASHNQHKFVVKVFTYCFFKFTVNHLEKLSHKHTQAMLDGCAEREYRVLRDCRAAGINCPKAVRLRNNAVLMTYIPDAVPLQDAHLTDEQYQKAYEQVLDMMERSYRQKKLIHVDLNLSNILWSEDKCVFIDFSQSIYLGEEDSFRKLMECCTKISRIFRDRLLTVLKPEEMFDKITDLTYGQYSLWREHNEAVRALKPYESAMSKLFRKYRYSFYENGSVCRVHD